MSTLIMSEGPESIFRLEHVSDDQLLTTTRQLVGRSNQLTTLLLLAPHLTEANHLDRSGCADGDHGAHARGGSG